MPGTGSWTKKPMGENIYFLFGGSRENKRAERLVKHWQSNGKNGIFLITGYPNSDDGEVESMIAYLISREVPRKSIKITASYETLSNVQSCVDVMKNHNNIYASTGPLHWLRFRLVFSLYYRWIKKNITYLPSGEKETWWYAVTMVIVYTIFTPKGWQKITQLIRKEKYEICQNSGRISAIAKEFEVTLIWHEKAQASWTVSV